MKEPHRVDLPLIAKVFLFIGSLELAFLVPNFLLAVAIDFAEGSFGVRSSDFSVWLLYLSPMLALVGMVAIRKGRLWGYVLVPVPFAVYLLLILYSYFKFV